jgi:hypothetical protein
LESIVTGPNDEWPIHPSDEWPIRPDPTPAREGDHDHTPPNLPRIYVAPDESENPSDQPSTKQSRKPQYKRSAVFTGILTLVFGIVFITDFFDGYELQLVGVYAFILLMGILDIFTDDDHDSPAYKKALREAKPRRVLISDDEQPIISITKPIDGRISDDNVWPVLPQKDPEPSTPEPTKPAKPEPAELKLEPYRPHLPLPEPSTWSQRVRRIAWILMVSLAFPLALTVLARIASPNEPGLAEVQIFGAIGCAICFFIAYFDLILLDGDN